jgi:hypothetical protein
MPLQQERTDHPHFSYWAGCLALFGLSSTVWMFWIVGPSSPGNISPIWAGVDVLLLVSSLALGIVTIRPDKLPQERIIELFTRHSTWLMPIYAVLAYILLGLVLYPAEQFPFLPSLIVRIQPIALFGSGAAVVNLVAIAYWLGQFDPSSFRNLFRNCKSQLLPFLIVFGILAAVVAFVFISRIGITPDLYWKVAGVPLLPMQLYAAAGCVLLYHFVVETWLPARFPSLQNHTGRVTAVLFLLIWIGAAVCWSVTPQSRSVFATGPYPPMTVMYPHSDAAVHDSGGAMIELGLPVNGGQFTDKPAYMFFIGLLHLLVGDDINRIVTGQVIVLALLPALLYLLGRELHSAKTGLLLAIIAIYRSANAIEAVTAITTTSVKELMSETPLALALAIICLLAFRYWKDRENARYPILLGGVYGISILIRPHPLFFLPFLLALLVLAGWKHFRRVSLHLGLFIGALALVLAPISISNYQQGRIPDYLQKINIVLKLRSEEAVTPAALAEEDDQILPVSSDTAAPIQENQPAATPAAATLPDAAVTPVITIPAPGTHYPVIENKVIRALSHALHNELTILLSMPGTFVFRDLDHTLQASIWDESGPWQGSLTAGQWIALLINLSILAVGLSFLFHPHRWIGLFPLVVQISINIANAFARSSGGRFLVPGDWIIYFYYALGLIELGRFVAGRAEYDIPQVDQSVRSTRPWELAALAAGFALYGLALGYIQVVIPDRFSPVSDPVSYLQNSAAAQIVNTKLPDLTGVLGSTRTTWLQGRALYPRYYPAGQGESSPNSEMRSLPYDRIVFELIGPLGNRFIVLPSAVRGKKLQHGSDVLVFGCSVDENTVDGWAVVIDPQGSPNLLVRDPQMPYACP